MGEDNLSARPHLLQMHTTIYAFFTEKVDYLRKKSSQQGAAPSPPLNPSLWHTCCYSRSLKFGCENSAGCPSLERGADDGIGGLELKLRMLERVSQSVCPESGRPAAETRVQPCRAVPPVNTKSSSLPELLLLPPHHDVTSPAPA